MKRKNFRYDQDEFNPIKINDKVIPFSSTAEHVGIIRSVHGNAPALASRFTAHKKALAGVLHSGLANHHRGNPASNVRIEKLYATPVLFSGLAALILNKSEILQIEKHYSNVLRGLLKLHEKTPRCVILFLAGSLPGSALLHLRQLCLFGMITRLSSSILHNYAKNFFSATPLQKTSWFYQILSLCELYSLPNPLSMLSSPLSKTAFKSLIKKKIISYWEVILRSEASALKSLCFFKPEFMSLTRPHSLLTSAGNSPSKVSMALVQIKMLSGRYRCDALLQHWQPSTNGQCQLSHLCHECEDIPHILQRCFALVPVRQKLQVFTENFVKTLPTEVKNIVEFYCNPSSPQFCNFLLDCSTLPPVISAAQMYGDDIFRRLYSLTGAWVYALHRERLKMRGSWKLSQH